MKSKPVGDKWHIGSPAIVLSFWPLVTGQCTVAHRSQCCTHSEQEISFSTMTESRSLIWLHRNRVRPIVTKHFWQLFDIKLLTTLFSVLALIAASYLNGHALTSLPYTTFWVLFSAIYQSGNKDFLNFTVVSLGSQLLCWQQDINKSFVKRFAWLRSLKNVQMKDLVLSEIMLVFFPKTDDIFLRKITPL